MTEHTPGPWKATTENATVYLHPWIVTTGKHVIADVYLEADAHLIAAAPQMLDELEEALRLYEEGMKSRAAAEAMYESGQVPKSYERIRAVITEARGLPPA